MKGDPDSVIQEPWLYMLADDIALDIAAQTGVKPAVTI
jgi:hypothetical protein